MISRGSRVERLPRSAHQHWLYDRSAQQGPSRTLQGQVEQQGRIAEAVLEGPADGAAAPRGACTQREIRLGGHLHRVHNRGIATPRGAGSVKVTRPMPAATASC